MRRVIMTVVVITLLAGCKTEQMKSTPFYEGHDVTYTGKAEDRVNLWPLAYWREPVGSVAWPLISWGQDHFAFRPVYSHYESEHNFLWPFGQYDSASGEGHVFPVFWGKDYFDIFPVVWNHGDFHSLFPLLFWEEDDYLTFFPLAWWDINGGSFTLLPLFGHSRKSDWLFPLWYHDKDTTLITPLGGYSNDSSWLFPLWYHDKDTTLITPLGGQVDDKQWFFPLWYHDKDTTLITPLGGYSKDSSWLVPLLYHDKDTMLITPLCGHSKDSSWLAPLFYKDSRYLVTPLWWQSFRYKTGETESWMIPPLLTGGGMNSDGSSYLYSPLGGFSGKKSELFLLFYKDEKSFYSLPFCQWGYDSKETTSFIPPLLSWHVSRTDWQSETRLLLGLYGHDTATNGNTSADWLFPLYFYNGDNGDIQTLLFGRYTQASHANWWWLTPLVGHTTGDQAGFWFLPLVNWCRDDKFASLEKMMNASTLDASITVTPKLKKCYDIKTESFVT